MSLPGPIHPSSLHIVDLVLFHKKEGRGLFRRFMEEWLSVNGYGEGTLRPGRMPLFISGGVMGKIPRNIAACDRLMEDIRCGERRLMKRDFETWLLHNVELDIERCSAEDGTSLVRDHQGWYWPGEEFDDKFLRIQKTEYIPIPPRRREDRVVCKKCRLPTEYDHVAWCMGLEDGMTCRC